MTKSLTMNECTSVPPVSTLEMMRRHDTANTSRWRGFRASVEATGRRHRVSIHVVSPRRTTGLLKKKTRRQSTILASRFAGPGGPPVLYRAHHPTEGVQGYHGSHWSPPSGEYGGRYIPSVTHPEVFSKLFHPQIAGKGARVTSRPLITIGV